MASHIIVIDDIVAGKIDWKIRVRIVNLWKIPDFNRPKESSSIELLLLDENVWSCIWFYSIIPVYLLLNIFDLFVCFTSCIFCFSSHLN